jgi:hypothetical protein
MQVLTGVHQLPGQQHWVLLLMRLACGRRVLAARCSMMQTSVLACPARTPDCMSPAAYGLYLPAVLLALVLLEELQQHGSVHDHLPRLPQQLL